MAKFQLQFGCAAFIILLNLYFASPRIECYDCIRSNGSASDCLQPKTSIRNAIETCDQTCIQHILDSIVINKTKLHDYIIRKCDDSAYCTSLGPAWQAKFQGQTRNCRSCNTDLCNGGSLSSATITIPFMLVGLLTAKYYFL